MRNDLTAALPKFCLAVEEHRRTPEGRVRSSSEFLRHFFPFDDKGVEDRVFRYLPKAVRGPIVTAWGIRGAKAALRDDDEKIQTVVHDALAAGDIDHGQFEAGLSAEVLMRWVSLQDWWTFWRGGRLTKNPILKALTAAYDLGLFDAKWFLETLQSRGGSLTGTDVLSEGLSKEDLTEWVRKIRESGDGSPKGLVSALGWEKIVAKTADDVLIAVLDAMAAKVALAEGPKTVEAAAPVDAPADGTSSETRPVVVMEEPLGEPASIDWGRPAAAAENGNGNDAPASGLLLSNEGDDIVVVDDELDLPTNAGAEVSGISRGLEESKKIAFGSRPEPAAPPQAKHRMR
jgi:hypothetical protein